MLIVHDCVCRGTLKVDNTAADFKMQVNQYFTDMTELPELLGVSFAVFCWLVFLPFNLNFV